MSAAVSLDSTPEPHLGHCPIALDGRRGDPEGFGRLVDSESGEVAKLDDAALLRVDALERVERGVEREVVEVRRTGERVDLVERNDRDVAAALRRPPSPRTVYQYMAHSAGGDREEMRSTLPVKVVLPD